MALLLCEHHARIVDCCIRVFELLTVLKSLDLPVVSDSFDMATVGCALSGRHTIVL